MLMRLLIIQLTYWCDLLIKVSLLSWLSQDCNLKGDSWAEEVTAGGLSRISQFRSLSERILRSSL